MSIRVIAWVFHDAPVSSKSDLLCLLAIADHAHDDGAGAFPSLRTIAAMARMSERNVRYSIRRLQAARLLSIESRVGRPSLYRVVMTPATVAAVQGGATVADPPRQALPTHPGNQQPDPGNQQPKPRQQLLPPNRKEPSQEPQSTAASARAARDDDPAAAAAIAAMSERGITNPEELLSFAAPTAILWTCEWFDRQRGIGPGLLAIKIRDGGVSDRRSDEQRAAEDLGREHPCDDANSKESRAWRAMVAKLEKEQPSIAAFLNHTHPHVGSKEGPLIIGAHPQTVDWLRSRFTNGHKQLLTGGSGRQLQFLPCPNAVANADLLVEQIKDAFDATEIDQAESDELARSGIETWTFGRDNRDVA